MYVTVWLDSQPFSCHFTHRTIFHNIFHFFRFSNAYWSATLLQSSLRRMDVASLQFSTKRDRWQAEVDINLSTGHRQFSCFFHYLPCQCHKRDNFISVHFAWYLFGHYLARLLTHLRLFRIGCHSMIAISAINVLEVRLVTRLIIKFDIPKCRLGIENGKTIAPGIDYAPSSSESMYILSSSIFFLSCYHGRYILCWLRRFCDGANCLHFVKEVFDLYQHLVDHLLDRCMF